MAIFTLQQRQTALWTGIGFLLILLLLLLGPILTPFIAGAILAYALNPVVDWLRSLHIGNFRLPRLASVVIVVLFLISLVTTFALIMIPMLLKEWPILYEQIPVFVAKVSNHLNPMLNEIGIQMPVDNAGVKKILTEQFFPKGDGVWKSLIASAKFGGTAVLTWAWNLILIPVVLFYLLLDWHVLTRKLRDMIPRRWVGKTIRFCHEVNTMLAQYLRGQLLVMLILSIYYSLALALAGYNRNHDRSHGFCPVHWHMHRPFSGHYGDSGTVFRYGSMGDTGYHLWFRLFFRRFIDDTETGWRPDSAAPAFRYFRPACFCTTLRVCGNFARLAVVSHTIGCL